MTTIGGYLEFEAPLAPRYLHPLAVALTSGRACLSLILQNSAPRKVFVPYYTCDALLEPILDFGAAVEFYALDEVFEPAEEPLASEDSLFIYVNYFGLKTGAARALDSRLHGNLVIDNSQAFYESPAGAYSFNSARKFFGVPDGAYLYGLGLENLMIEPNLDVRADHLMLRALGRVQEGYRHFQESEALVTSRVRSMSSVSAAILGRLEYQECAARRRTNFAHLHERLGDLNQIKLPLGSAVPLCYPFLPEASIDRNVLVAQDIFVPRFWQDCLNRASGYEREKDWADRLLPLPIDHRYDTSDMDCVAATIKTATSGSSA